MPTPTPKTPLGLLRQKLGLIQRHMAFDLNLSISTFEKLERGKPSMPEGIARRISRRYMVDWKWLMNGDPEEDRVYDVFGRDWEDFSEKNIRGIRDRFNWESEPHDDVPINSVYCYYLTWVLASQALAQCVERPEDFRQITVSLPSRSNTSDGGTGSFKTLSFADLLPAAVNRDFRALLWDKAPLLAIDCMISGSDEFRELPLEVQIDLLKKAIEHDRKRNDELASEYKKQCEGGTTVAPEPPAELLEDPHHRVWRRLTRAVERTKNSDPPSTSGTDTA